MIKKGRKASTKVTFERKWHKPSSGRKRERVYISDKKLRLLVISSLAPHMAANFNLYLGDDKYFCTPLEDAREIIKASAVDRKKWVEERFDCDDFAIVLKAHFAEAGYKDGKRRAAHCFGIVWGSLPTPHAINWMVNADRRLRFVEPQNNRIFLPRRTDKDIYFMLA